MFTRTTINFSLRLLYKAFSTVIVTIDEDCIVFYVVDETRVTLDRKTFLSCIGFSLQTLEPMYKNPNDCQLVVMMKHMGYNDNNLTLEILKRQNFLLFGILLFISF